MTCKIPHQHSETRHQEVCLAKHTPTPWAVEGKFGIVATEILNDGKPHVRDVATTGIGWRPGEDNIANAAFIVRAVNAHDALVTTLETALYAISENQLGYAVGKIKDALKLAGENSSK